MKFYRNFIKEVQSSKIKNQSPSIRKDSGNQWANQSSPVKSNTSSTFKVLFQNNNDEFKIPNRLEKSFLKFISERIFFKKKSQFRGFFDIQKNSKR